MIKDKLLLSSDSSFLYKKCHSCSKNSHFLFKCPLLNPLILRTHLVNKITTSKPQSREPFFRKNCSKFNARKKISFVQKTQILVLMNIIKSEESLSRSSNLTISSSNSSGKEQFFKKERSDKLSIILEKEDENSSEFSYENIISTKKKSLNQANERNLSIKNNEQEEENDSKEQEENSSNLAIIKNLDDEEQISDYDTLKLFNNYQPHFNYNVILTKMNQDLCQESTFTASKKEKKPKKFKINSKKFLDKIKKK